MERFETLKKLASGSYGDVYLCRDKKQNGGDMKSTVAVKVFMLANSHAQVLKSALREAALLELCSGHPNIVQLHQAYRSDSGRIYLVLEYLPKVLSSVILSQHKSTGAFPKHVFWDTMKQLLQGVRFLHQKQVIHRDLKPSNIMMSEDGTVKVIDLGLARQCRPHVDDLTEYVQTRWYRSPELLLGLQYGYEVDIWAMGCIAAEMVLGFPIFKGKSHIDQLQVILQCFGSLPRRFQHQLESLNRSGKLKIPSKGDVLGLAGWLPKSTPQDILSFITSCLELNPLVRPSAEDLLRLPQFTTAACQFTDRCQTDYHPGTKESSIPRSLHSKVYKVSASPFAVFAAGMQNLGGLDKKEIEGEEHSLHGNTSTASKSRVLDLSSDSGVIRAGSGLGGQSTRDSATCNNSSRRLMSKGDYGALLRPSVLAIDSTTTLSRHRSGCIITSQEVQEESETSDSTDYNTVAAGTMRRFVQQKAAAGAQQDSTIYEKTKPSGIKGGEDNNGDAGSPPPSSRPYQRAFQSRSRSAADTLLLTLQMKAGHKIIPHHQPLSSTSSITSSTGGISGMSPIPQSGITTPGAPIPLPHLHRNSKQASRAAHQDDEGQQAPGTAVAPSGDKYLRGRELHAASHLPLNIHHSSAGTPGLEPKDTVQHKQQPDQAAGVLPLQLPHHSAVLQERQPQRRCASGPLELIHQPCSSIIKHAAVASHNHFDPSLEMTSCQQSSAAGGAGHYGHGFHHSQKTSFDSRNQSIDNEDAASSTSRLKDHNYSSAPLLYRSSKAGQQPRGSLGRTVSMELPAHYSSSPSDAAGILGVANVSALKIIKSRRSTGEDGRFVWASSRLSKSGNADVSEYDGQSLNNTATAVGTSTLTTTYPAVPSQLGLNAALNHVLAEPHSLEQQPQHQRFGRATQQAGGSLAQLQYAVPPAGHRSSYSSSSVSILAAPLGRVLPPSHHTISSTAATLLASEGQISSRGLTSMHFDEHDQKSASQNIVLGGKQSRPSSTSSSEATTDVAPQRKNQMAS